MNKTESERALDTLARLLTKRDHSLLELRQKLERQYSLENVDAALKEAEGRRWLSSEEEIAARAVEVWQRRLKSRAYIEQQLLKRGLPIPPRNEEKELENLRRLVEKKFGSPISDLKNEDRLRAERFLQYRGFDETMMRMVFNE